MRMQAAAMPITGGYSGLNSGTYQYFQWMEIFYNRVVCHCVGDFLYNKTVSTRFSRLRAAPTIINRSV
jgi:hypothetical protein